MPHPTTASRTPRRRQRRRHLVEPADDRRPVVGLTGHLTVQVAVGHEGHRVLLERTELGPGRRRSATTLRPGLRGRSGGHPEVVRVRQRASLGAPGEEGVVDRQRHVARATRAASSRNHRSSTDLDPSRTQGIVTSASTRSARSSVTGVDGRPRLEEPDQRVRRHRRRRRLHRRERLGWPAGRRAGPRAARPAAQAGSGASDTARRSRSAQPLASSATTARLRSAQALGAASTERCHAATAPVDVAGVVPRHAAVQPGEPVVGRRAFQPVGPGRRSPGRTRAAGPGSAAGSRPVSSSSTQSACSGSEAVGRERRGRPVQTGAPAAQPQLQRAPAGARGAAARPGPDPASSAASSWRSASQASGTDASSDRSTAPRAAGPVGAVDDRRVGLHGAVGLDPGPLGPRRHRDVLQLGAQEAGLDLEVAATERREPLLPVPPAGTAAPDEQLAAPAAPAWRTGPGRTRSRRPPPPTAGVRRRAARSSRPRPATRPGRCGPCPSAPAGPRPRRSRSRRTATRASPGASTRTSVRLGDRDVGPPVHRHRVVVRVDDADRDDQRGRPVRAASSRSGRRPRESARTPTSAAPARRPARPPAPRRPASTSVAYARGCRCSTRRRRRTRPRAARGWRAGRPGWHTGARVRWRGRRASAAARRGRAGTPLEPVVLEDRHPVLTRDEGAVVPVLEQVREQAGDAAVLEVRAHLVVEVGRLDVGVQLRRAGQWGQRVDRSEPGAGQRGRPEPEA